MLFLKKLLKQSLYYSDVSQASLLCSKKKNTVGHALETDCRPEFKEVDLSGADAVFSHFVCQFR